MFYVVSKYENVLISFKFGIYINIIFLRIVLYTYERNYLVCCKHFQYYNIQILYISIMYNIIYKYYI